jgi:hypothetical protein
LYEMTEKLKGAHPELDEIVDYFASTLPEEAAEALEHHFAECDECARAARRVYTSNQLVDNWSAHAGKFQSNAQAVLALSLATLLERTENADWRNRLRAWSDRWAYKADGAVRMVIEEPSKTARIITDGLAELLRPGARWEFALEFPRPSASVRGRQRRHTISVAVAAGTPQVRVAATSEVGQVEVRIDDLPAGTTPPLVVLAAVMGNAEPQIRELRPSGDASHWIACFEGLEAGDYLVILEPAQ